VPMACLHEASGRTVTLLPCRRPIGCTRTDPPREVASVSARRRPSKPSLRLLLLLTVPGGAALVASCGESVTQVGADDIATLRVTPDSVFVGVDRSVAVQALALDQTGSFLVGQEVVWSTAASDVATVDASGVVTGVTAGETQITAAVGAFSATAVVTVLQPPELVLSESAVHFTAFAGGLNPAPDSVLVTNGGVLALVGLSVDSIGYGPGAEGWALAEFRSSAAPTALILEGRTTAITDPGDYEATVWISGEEAEGSPASVMVSLTVEDGPPPIVPTTLSIAAGDGQTQVSGLNVPTPPTVTVLDQFGDPVLGAVVDFTPSGSGSVGSASVTTNASGLAATTWAVEVGGATLQSDGTYPNTLTATVQGTALATAFNADAIYSYGIHVNPVLCVGCHSGSPPAAGLSLDGDATADYEELVDEPLTCDDDGAALPATHRRVSTEGGTQAADDFSMILRYIDPALTGIGACDAHGFHPKPYTADQLEIIRAWIRNGAPEN